jgi:hypothetical protein
VVGGDHWLVTLTYSGRFNTKKTAGGRGTRPLFFHLRST